MQFFNSSQQPRDEERTQNKDEREASGQRSQQGAEASQPLYEFPASGPLPAVGEAQAATDRASQSGGPASAVPGPANPGFVYPPPPSYYQNMPTTPSSPPLPLPVQGSKQASMPAANFAPGVRPPLRPDNRHAGPLPSFQADQPAAKKSYKWVWLAVSIISICVLTGCGLGIWGVYTIINSSYQQVAGSLDVVNDYYSNLQAKNYVAAYNDLAPRGQISGLTQAQFVKQATQLEDQYGPVISFVPSQPNFSTDPASGPVLTHLTLTVEVKRSHDSYTVLFTLDKIGNNWKITDYDRI